MKNIINTIIAILALTSCSNYTDLFEETSIRGGYVIFEDMPSTLEVDLAEVSTATINENLIDPNDNVVSYSLTLYYNDTTINDFVVYSSFPTTLNLKVSDFTETLGIEFSDITTSTSFSLISMITTTSGITYSGASPNIEEIEDGVYENTGGNTTNRLKADAMHAAVDFEITFFE